MDSEQISLFRSVQQHPKTWSLCTFLWVLSCYLVWKCQLFVLERSQRAGYTLYSTPKSSDMKSANPKTLPWYLPQIGPKFTPECKDLLERYANVPVEKQEAHIKRVRDAAFHVCPLATIGEFWFLVLGLAEHPRYPLIIHRLVSAPDKSIRLLIDIGTCLGQDLRKLVLDGAAPSQLFSVDKFGQFEELGFNLFRDNNNFANVFAEADIFSEEKSSALSQTIGTWDIVTSSMLLHAFDWPAQVTIVKKMMALTRGKGSWMAGLLAGDVESQEVPVLPPLVPEGMKVTRFIHNKHSLRQLFEEAQVGTSIKLKVEIEVQEDKKSVYTQEIQSGFFTTEEARLLFYFVEIV